MQNASDTDDVTNLPQPALLRDAVERTPDDTTAPAASWPLPRIVYSKHYHSGVIATHLAASHFLRREGETHRRVWARLLRKFGPSLNPLWINPAHPITDEELQRFHSPQYLQQLKDPAFLAQLMEAPRLRLLPRSLADRFILRPMRFAAMGTLLAAQAALEHGIAINLAGGFHLASQADGYGLSAYADVPLAISELRRTEKLAKRDCVAYIDMHPQQGLGVCRSFLEDRRVFIYDQYNGGTFPRDVLAQERIDCDVPMKSGCSDKEYIEELQWRLPRFLDAVTIGGNLKLAIYNLPLEIQPNLPRGMNLTEKGFLARDKFVLKELIERHIPTLVIFGGHCGSAGEAISVDRATLILKKWGRLAEAK